MKELYGKDVYFKEYFEAYKNPNSQNRSSWLEYMIQDGLLFTNNQLHIPNCSMRGKLIKENHKGVLGGNFGQDKTYDLLKI